MSILGRCHQIVRNHRLMKYINVYIHILQSSTYVIASLSKMFLQPRPIHDPRNHTLKTHNFHSFGLDHITRFLLPPSTNMPPLQASEKVNTLSTQIGAYKRWKSGYTSHTLMAAYRPIGKKHIEPAGFAQDLSNFVAHKVTRGLCEPPGVFSFPI